MIINNYKRFSCSEISYTIVRHFARGFRKVQDQVGELEPRSELGRNIQWIGNERFDEDSDSDSDDETEISTVKVMSKGRIVEIPKASSLSLPALSRRSLNLAVFVNRSETLQKMVMLGVDLSKVQEFDGIANLLLRSNFNRDVAPYIRFLVDIGVPADKVGQVLTINPLILTEEAQDLEQRVGFLCHKEFNLEDVGSMFSRAPVLALMTPEHLERKLGFLQQTFRLSDSELRKVAVKCPGLLPYKEKRIAMMRFTVKEFLGFDEKEMKELLLKCPDIYTMDTRRLTAVFDFLHNTVLIPHNSLLFCPDVLLHDLEGMSSRHAFLKSRGRDQFNPRLESYVSLTALVSGTDEEFCREVADCEMHEYIDFLKTM